MKASKTRSLHLLIGLVISAISGCSKPESVDIPQLLAESLVKINYADGQTAYGSGFVIEGKQEGCTVLTAEHVVPEGQSFRITTHDNGYFKALSVRRSLDDNDIAVLTFKVKDSKRCPYPALELSNSYQVSIGDLIYLAGYPDREGDDDVFAQFPRGRVTRIGTTIARGYSLSYDITAAGGMSGGPVVNSAGQVVAVHGRTDREVVALGRSEQSNNQSAAQKEEIEKAEDRIESGVAQHFKWGVLIEIFLDEKDDLLASSRKWNNLLKTWRAEGPLKSAEQKRNEGRLEEAVALYEEALQIDPDNVDARNGMITARSLQNDRKEERSRKERLSTEKGSTLFEQGFYEKALEEYNLALDERNPVHWMNIGATHYQLKQYVAAIRAYKRATDLNPDSFEAWHGYAIALRAAGESYKPRTGPITIMDAVSSYEKSIEAFDRALQLNSDEVDVWYGKASALEGFAEMVLVQNWDGYRWSRGKELTADTVGAFEDALNAYDQVLAIDSDHALAWNGRGHVLEKLNRMDEVMESYLNASELEPENQDFERDVNSARPSGINSMPKLRER